MAKRKPKPASRARAKRPLPPVISDAVAAFERTLAKNAPAQHYVLRLYVTGSTARSATAISNIRRLCEEHLAGNYDLEVVDIYQQPVLAQGEQIIAAPTLIKKLPYPLRKIVGDLSDKDRVLIGLDLQPRDTPAPRRGE